MRIDKGLICTIMYTQKSYTFGAWPMSDGSYYKLPAPRISDEADCQPHQ